MNDRQIVELDLMELDCQDSYFVAGCIDTVVCIDGP